MRRQHGAMVLFGLFTSGLFTSAALAGPKAGGEAVPPVYRNGEVLVTWKTDDDDARAVRSKLGMEPRLDLRGGRSQCLRLPSMMRVEDAVVTLRADPAVAHAEPNYLKRASAAVPADPYFPQQWALLNSGQANDVDGGPAGVPGADLNLTQAWDADGDGIADRVGDGSAIVAIIDDGVDSDHPDLVANLLPGYDFDNNDGDANPDSGDQTHGTLIAGIIGAAAGNGQGIVGVAWNVGLMPLQFDFDTATEIAAFEYARDHGVRIINASFGSPFYSQIEYDALAELADAGILVVTSAGNDDADLDASRLSYPARYDLPNVLTVAATNRQDQIASFSTYGATTVELAAPGLQITSTVTGGGYTDDGATGSSFAAAHVSGLAALVWMQYPDADYREVIGRLVTGAEPADGAALRSAAGRANADLALDATPAPALLVRGFEIDPDGNGALEPGETAIVRITVENFWLAATGVTSVLSTSSALSLSATPVAFGDIAKGERASADFAVTVPTGFAPHQRLVFELSLDADGGYAADRYIAAEFGALSNGVPVSVVIGEDFYDEFQTLSFKLDSLPEGHDTLTLRVVGSNDLDLLVGQDAPAGYSIGLNGSAPFIYDVPYAQVGGTPYGDEFVNIGNPQPGTYYLTVVNFDQAENAEYTVEAYTSAGGYTGYRNSTDAYYDSLDDDDGGGAWQPSALLPLLIAALLRRRVYWPRRSAATA